MAGLRRDLAEAQHQQLLVRLEQAYLRRGRRECVYGVKARRDLIREAFAYVRLKHFKVGYEYLCYLLTARFRFLKEGSREEEISFQTLYSDVKRVRAGEV